jgi:hypothetical protein
MVMIKVIRGPMSSKATFAYRATGCGFAVEGRSRQPLLDACRQLKRMGVDPAEQCGLFREGHSDWDLRTTIGYGARKTISETNRRGVKLAEFRPHYLAAPKELGP